jgi:hypothetical protein
MSTDTEGRIEGDSYYALWRRNDRRWGHAIDVKLFDLGGTRVVSPLRATQSSQTTSDISQ